MIPGTKQILKKVLLADYNNPNAAPDAEPKKPNSLNHFLQFRKEFMNESPVYRNLPPQEGLFEEPPEQTEEKKLAAEADEMRQNVDFKLIDLDADIAKMKRATPTDPDRDEEVFELMEQREAAKKGELFKENMISMGDTRLVEAEPNAVRRGRDQDPRRQVLHGRGGGEHRQG